MTCTDDGADDHEKYYSEDPVNPRLSRERRRDDGQGEAFSTWFASWKLVKGTVGLILITSIV